MQGHVSPHSISDELLLLILVCSSPVHGTVYIPGSKYRAETHALSHNSTAATLHCEHMTSGSHTSVHAVSNYSNY